MSSNTKKLDDAMIEVETLLQHAKNDVDRLSQCLPSQRTNFQNEIKAQLDAIENKITRINNEARSLTPSIREYYTNEVKSLSSQHQDILNSLRREETLSANNLSLKQANQIEKNINKAQGINETLDEAIRLGNDSITTANATMTTLIDDRKRISHINENIDVIDREALTGMGRAKRMVRRACFNNCIIWTIVVLLTALFGFSLYWKLRKTD